MADPFSFARLDPEVSERLSAPRYSYWRSTAAAFLKKRLALACMALALILIAMAFIQPMFSGYRPGEAPNINRSDLRNLAPSPRHWFGTDSSGNELWDVVWSGTRISLMVAFLVSLINIGLGLVAGAAWGYSKRLDPHLIEIYNVVSNVPGLLRNMILMYLLGRGFWQLIVAFCLTGWLDVAFFIRTQVMIIRDREYNLASRCLGTPMPRLLARNILPYMVSVVCTLVYKEIPGVINAETIISYLGFGLPLSYPSLGRMIDQYWPFMDTYPHLIIIPGLVMALITVSFYVAGQALADASDPRAHR